MMKQRDDTLDLLRLGAILLVVMIHYSNYYCRYLTDVHTISFGGAILYNGLARICVPLFFMLSGALMLGRAVEPAKLKKKVLRFFSVLVVWTIFYFVWDILFMKKEFDLEQILRLPFEPLKPHLWFMYAIIALYIVLPFAKILVDHMSKQQEKWFLLLWLVFCGGGQLWIVIMDRVGYLAEVKYPLPMTQEGYYLGYFIAGHILYKQVKNGKQFSTAKTLVVYLISMLSTIAAAYLSSVKDGAYYDSFYAYRNLTVMTATLCAFVLLISKVKLKKDSTKRFLGKLSPCLFGVYLIHIVFYNILIMSVDITAFPALIAIPLETVLTVVVSLAVVVVMRKIPVVKEFF